MKRGVQFHWTALAMWSAFIVFIVLLLSSHKTELSNGEDQLAAMRAFFEAEAFQDYLARSVSLSVDSATRTLADKGGLHQSAGEIIDPSFGCGTWRGSPLLNNESKDCFPARSPSLPEESFKQLVAENLNYYLATYPRVSMYVSPDDLIITSTDSTLTVASAPTIPGVAFDISKPGAETENGEGSKDVAPWSIWPVHDVVTDCYGGPRAVQGANPWHQGVDFNAPIGTPIHAVSDGEVFSICRFGIDGTCRGYGNEIVIKHNDKLYSHYAHLSKFLVEKGDEVKTGDVIGLSGNTGFGTGPHLHFSVFTNPERNNQEDYSQNAFRFLPQEYEGLKSPCPLDTYTSP